MTLHDTDERDLLRAFGVGAPVSPTTTLWYLGPGDRICVDVIRDGLVAYRTCMIFPSAGSPALFWLAVSALKQGIELEVWP